MSKKKSKVQILYDPYSKDGKTFQNYFNDTKAVLKINDKTFYRALLIMCFGDGGVTALLDNKLNLSIDDKVIDDNNNVFTVKGFAMMRAVFDIPDWYAKASFVKLSGNFETIGHYFSKL